jgi:hypothetical protein
VYKSEWEGIGQGRLQSCLASGKYVNTYYFMVKISSTEANYKQSMVRYGFRKFGK